MSAFGGGYADSYGARDSYDPYTADAEGPRVLGHPGGPGGFGGPGGPGGPDGPDDDDSHLPQHRRGSRLILLAAIGMLALMVVGAVTFAGSLLMSRTAGGQKPAAAAGAASGDPAGGAIPADASGDPAPSSAPAENATASAPPTTSSPKPAKTQTTPPARPRTTGAQGTGNAAYEAQVLTIVNSERAKAGCKPLAFNAKLTTAARKHSADMAARNYFSHDTPDGVSFATRISNEGYNWSGAAENIAKGQRTPADVMKAWMDSSGHRANILNCGLKDLGVGVAYQGKTPIWTQDFGSPR